MHPKINKKEGRKNKMEYYTSDLKELFDSLKTNEKGLTKREALIRIEKYGKNEIKVEKKINPLVIFINQFRSGVVYILIVALIISAFLREVVDSIVIASILILNGIFGFIQEWKAEKAVEALKKLESLKARVLRDGRVEVIDSSLLVPGDIVLLETGDKVPADARLIEAKELKTQEAILTGESTPVKKSVEIIKEKVPVSEQKNMVFSGTTVINGRGKALVVATGMNTEMGKIAHLIEKIERTETPLQKKVKDLGKFLGVLVIIIAIIVFAAGFLRGGDALEMLLIGVSLAVAAIPEGLVVFMTIALALGTQRMAKRKALIRKLAAVETLGSTTVICADKTGTITKNEMTVKKIFVNNKIIDVEGIGYKVEGRFLQEGKEIEIKREKELLLLLEIGLLNNNSNLEGFIGDPTELALLVSAMKAGLNKQEIESKKRRVDEVFFTSERKMMTTVHKTDSEYLVYTKGACELVLDICNKIYENGRIRKLTKTDRKKILEINEKLAEKALRVLAFAFKKIKKKKDEYEKDLIFVGLQAMMDPPRKEVKESIQICKGAGIDVKIITGDHVLTAKAIAEQIGIESKAITGKELEEMDQDEFENKVEKISVFARVNPEHKLRIVEALQKKGHVVAMTGDGVNDAPALKKADIGVAMGIKGTDVAKEASDMILEDDNFASIVAAVEEGRGSYDNIKKFTNYLLSSNVGEVLLIFIAMLIGFRADSEVALPLIASQILWMNLVTDGLPAIALSADPVEENLMKRKPREKTEGIITKNMLWSIIFIGSLIAILTLIAFSHFLPELAKAQTVVLTSLVIFEMVRAYMIKARYGRMFNNNLLLLSLILAIVLQLAIIYTPIHPFFKLVYLNTKDWLYILGLTVIFALSGFLSQTLIRKITKTQD